jgi:hypothetical protein
MTSKLLAVLLIIVIITCALPLTASAEVEPPATLSAPEHFGASHYIGDYLYFTFSAPEDLRNYIEKRAADDPDNKQTFSINFQVDYKINDGNWHYTSAWDSPKTVPDGLKNFSASFRNEKIYSFSDRWSMSSIFREDEALSLFKESGWDYLNGNSITFRARFAQSFDNGKTYVLSPWSKEYTLSANIKADYNKLINHAPALLSADVQIAGGGEPYFEVRLGKAPGDIQDLSSMSGNSVRTEIWMRRAGDKDFKYIHYQWSNHEYLEIQASDYFEGATQSYDAEGYEIKTRYALDLSKYKQSGQSDDIYGPFSNVISHNMPAWSEASSWATGELKKADNAGLIPNILKGADLTKPITREEFCELALMLYEKSTGKSPAPASPNPFIDTKNPQVLKAFALGITTGTSATTFSPQVLINREQCAAMLYRALRVIAPEGGYSIEGVKDFPDQKNIASYAVEATKYMSKLGIIKGDNNGNFMPKATTTAQEATGYGAATREASILMSVRSYDQIQSGALGTPTGEGSATPEPTPAPEPTPEPTPEPQTGAPKSSGSGIAGMWMGYVSYGSVSNSRYIDYVFNSDGTFVNLIHSTNDLTCTVYKGNYTISGSTLNFTNRLRAEFDYIFYDSGYGTRYNKIVNLAKQSENAAFSPADDAEFQFSLTTDSDGQLLKIDSFEYRAVSTP